MTMTLEEKNKLLQANYEKLVLQYNILDRNYKDLCKTQEALAQPAQEPVAHIKQGMDGYPKLVFNGKFEYESIAAKWDDIPLYTHPAPSWQGLSDDEINNLHHKWIMNSGNKDTQYDFARAIEVALKEKNAI